jgi:hypothetical protein
MTARVVARPTGAMAVPASCNPVPSAGAAALLRNSDRGAGLILADRVHGSRSLPPTPVAARGANHVLSGRDPPLIVHPAFRFFSAEILSSLEPVHANQHRCAVNATIAP